ncbi:MAG: glycosyltransferase family 4 protein [Rhodospirillaceae bacterium]|jgi:glycosyltransferase involved in cell wall biosynthesis|nr:glycosyltransferase family 4 protein [Rhodospirillaceae bacterium]MBT3809530.1 glycosyltransferase family 4 protein [Rhodospirillaceae bacterium]MBT3929857.1 glycosyltransferase family 4 protein [Rhodospirillaceae bacterium]MBT4773533.1 glycosyltransferase family 4 protein [Rhodospirillaceae bacterium]MBT5358025.1 glycosyltransferase family 4 protein [Rhodospirillaceae bacterium]
MKICQLCTVDFTLYHFLLPLMHRLRDEGHDVAGVCAAGPLAQAVADNGFTVHDIPLHRSANPLRNRRAYTALCDLFRAEAYDMVHVHTPVAGFVGRAAAARTGVPRVVYTAHGFFFHEHMPPVRRASHISLEWLAGRVTHTLFTQSEEDAATARRLGLCRTGDIMAIGNGSDPGVFRPAAGGDAGNDGQVRAKLRTALGTPEARVVIVMIGRLVAEKGYVELCEAMRSVNAELWVVGERLESDHADGVESLIDAVAMDPDWADRIRFLGYRDDVPDLLRAADIFTLPSHREGMPRSVIEAMLTGLPVVATNIRGVREELVHGTTGLLVPVRDSAALATALNQLVADSDERARMGAEGLARARALYDESHVLDRQIDHLALRRTGG